MEDMFIYIVRDEAMGEDYVYKNRQNAFNCAYDFISHRVEEEYEENFDNAFSEEDIIDFINGALDGNPAYDYSEYDTYIKRTVFSD